MVLSILSLRVTSASAQKRSHAAAEECATASETAQTLKDQHKLKEARERLLVCTRPQCPRPIKRDCDDLLSQVDEAMPTIVPGAKDARGQDVADARVLLDGTLVHETLDGSPIAVDPGAHLMRIERPGGVFVEQSIVVRESEKNRLVELQFPSGAPVVVALPPQPPAEEHPSGVPWSVYALGGVSAAALGVFAYLAVSGQSDYDACKSGPCDVGALETRRTVAWSLLGVSAVAAGATVWVLVSHASRPKNGTAVAFTPTGVLGRF